MASSGKHITTLSVRTIKFHDNRGGANGYTKEPMSDTEFELCEFAEPGFEDFSELWRRIETFLQMKGIDPLRDGGHPEADAVSPRRLSIKAIRRSSYAVD